MQLLVYIAPCKTKRFKANTQKWFNGEVVEDINTSGKILNRFKKQKLYIDKEFYRKAKCSALKLITTNKVFDDKFSECLGKPKEQWDTLKFLGMLKKNTDFKLQCH